MRESFWFLPAMLVTLAILLALGAGWLDRSLAESGRGLSLWFFYQGSHNAARAMLSTIATSMITVAGLVFSITMVVLSLTSSQFGPRLMKNFMEDRSNQFVLGVFLATFTYCLTVQGTMDGGDGGHPVRISLTVGMVLTLGSLAVLIYFIHHMADAIQADKLLATVGGRLEHAVRRLYPNEPPRNPLDLPRQPALPASFAKRAAPINADRSGYVLIRSLSVLLEEAEQADLLVETLARPGDFVLQGSPLALAWPPESLNESRSDTLRRAFVLGRERSPVQDVGLPLNELVEAALRGLSPGINDPFTAMTSLNWLADGLGLLAGREMPPTAYYDGRNELRVIARPVTLVDLADTALHQLRPVVAAQPAVTEHLMVLLAGLAPVLCRLEDVDCLLRHVNLLLADARQNAAQAADRARLERKAHEAVTALEQARQSLTRAGDESSREEPQ